MGLARRRFARCFTVRPGTRDDSAGGLLRACRSLVDRLDLPDPFTAEAFVAQLAGLRGRPITLVPVRSRPHLPCGLLVTTADSDLIVFFADTPADHREHIILHEAAHLLCGHDLAAPLQTGSARGLLPTLSDALVTRVLGRTVYSEPQEREAELVASLIRIRCRARGVAPAPATNAPADGAATSRVGTLFGVAGD